jgi:hypothetical protein
LSMNRSREEGQKAGFQSPWAGVGASWVQGSGCELRRRGPWPPRPIGGSCQMDRGRMEWRMPEARNQESG